jgi:hypothetical protein
MPLLTESGFILLTDGTTAVSVLHFLEHFFIYFSLFCFFRFSAQFYFSIFIIVNKRLNCSLYFSMASPRTFCNIMIDFVLYIHFVLSETKFLFSFRTFFEINRTPFYVFLSYLLFITFFAHFISFSIFCGCLNIAHRGLVQLLVIVFSQKKVTNSFPQLVHIGL